MDSSVIGVIITQIGAILIASGGWYFGAKKDREKTREMMADKLQDLKDDVTDLGANLQQKIAILEVQIDTLSERVNKHNNVIERMYKCEQAIEDLKKQ